MHGSAKCYSNKYYSKMKISPLLGALALAPALFLAAPAAADEVFRATSAITLPGTQQVQSFDISWVDPRLGLYLLADRTNKSVDVVRTDTNQLVTQLMANFAGAQGGNNDIAGPNGIITIGHQVWAGDGDSTLKIIDLNTGQLVVPPISTGGTKRADELCFDPKERLVLIANDADSPPFITFISVESDTVVGKILMNGTLGTPNATGGIEQCQWNPRTGKFLLNLPEVNGPGDDTAAGAVVVISPKSMKVERTFIVDHSKCAGPQGMAIGPEHQVLLGCNQPSGLKEVGGPPTTDTTGNGKFSTVVIDDDADHIIAALGNESGSDEVWFNPGDDHYFLARSSAAGNQQVGIVDAKHLGEDASVIISSPGTGNAHSVAADPFRNQVYVPVPATATAGVCASAGGTNARGCIAVITANHDDCSHHGRDDDHRHGDEDKCHVAHR
jgi:hypothetical protein